MLAFGPPVVAADTSIFQYHLTQLNVKPAWSITRGSGARVAVLDSVIQPDHPEFVGRVVSTWDGAPLFTDTYSHATMVGGIVAAADDKFGTVGVAPEATLISIPIFITGQDIDDSLSAGISLAIGLNADVINLAYQHPLGSTITYTKTEIQLQRAQDAGIVIVAGVGNFGCDCPTKPAILPTVISVGGTNEQSEIGTFSAYGDWVTIWAPGQSIRSTSPGGRYTTVTGTSAAAPQIAAAAALLKSINRNLTPVQIKTILLSTVDSHGQPNIGDAVFSQRAKKFSLFFSGPIQNGALSILNP